MRLLLLAINFFLVLTLGNAIMYRHNLAYFHRQGLAAIQVPHLIAMHYVHDAAIMREIGAVVLTMLIFGAAAYMRTSRGHPMTP